MITSIQAQPTRGPGGEVREPFVARTLPKDDAEKRILSVIEEVGRTQRRGNMIVPEQDGRILRVLAESIGARHVVELGTSVGYSGLWFCLALERTDGRLTTFEIDEGRAAQARENFRRAGVAERVTIVLGDAHETVRQVKDPVDMVFLDADKEGYLDYLQKLLPLVRPGGLIVAHNITPGMADPRYIEAITNNPALETIFLNLHASGISVSLKKR
jgi:predicted O-methyltransferase YrrM